MKEITDDIRSKIHNIRGMQVMLDSDLAVLYGIKTKNLNKAVSRNIERFPDDFMFRLTEKEYESLRFQIGTLRLEHGEHRKYLPYVFTEQGIAGLSGVLRSRIAINMNIQIMRAFVMMRRFIARNVELVSRIDGVERRQLEFQIETKENFKKVFEVIESRDIKPQKGIFFDGQVFDAYKFVSDIIRSAKSSIIIIDNYVDDSVLSLLTKREAGVSATIFTKGVNRQLQLDLDKHNSQYPHIEIKRFNDCHDRFIIIDNKTVYHFGASLKDLGKKWFGFSKFGKKASTLLERLWR